jgi:hypothetical protein
MKANKTLTICLAMLLLLTGTSSMFAWDSTPDANGKYDQYFDRPTHFPDWEQPATWPNVQMFLCEVHLGSAVAPHLTNYEIAVYDQDGELRHCNRSIAKDDDFCVLTVRGEEGDEFHFKIIYGDDFLHPTIVDVPDVTYQFKTNEVVGSASAPFTLIGSGRLFLSENAALTAVSKTGVDVAVERTLNAGEWSTICLPFSVAAHKMDAVFGDGWKLANFTGCDVTYEDDDETIVKNINVKFEAATAIEANHPYIIKVSSDILQIDIDDVDLIVTGDEEPSVDCDEYAYQAQVGKNKYETRYLYNSFVGNYAPDFLVPDQCLFLSGGKFWYSKGKSKLRAFRAYFDFYENLPESFSAEAGSRITFSISDNEQTAVKSISPVPAVRGGICYSLDGRQVQNPAKGLYIRDGKKVVVK